jgi:putative ABC transport system permease protein
VGFLAWASVRAHPIRLFATALSVVLSIAFVTGTYVFTDTVRSAFDQLFGSAASGVDVMVRAVPAFEASAAARNRPKVPETLVPVIEAVEGVAAVEPRYSGLAPIVDDEGEVLGQTVGPPKAGTDVPTVPGLATVELAEGRYPTGPDEVAIDVVSAETLGRELGEQVGVVLNGPVREFTLVGTVTLAGGLEDLAGSTFTLFDDTTAQQLYGGGGAVSLSVLAAEGIEPDAVRDAVATAVGNDYEVLTGEQVATEAADQIGEFLGFLTTGLLIFAGVALVVGAVIIFNTFGITITQRTRELALLQAVGADRRQVLQTVLLEALVIGAVGSVLGVAVGVAVASGLRALLDVVGVPLPSTALVLAPRTAVVGLALGMVVTLLAAIGPAARASRVAPIEALRAAETQQVAGLSRARAIAGGVAALVGLVALWRLVAGAQTQPVRWLLAVGALAVLAAVVLLSPLLMTPLARVLGRPLAAARGLTAALARENATRNPRRTATTAAALIIGLGLVCFVLIFIASLRGSVDAVLDERFLADYQVQAADGRGFPEPATEALRGVAGLDVISPVKFGFLGVGGSARTTLGVEAATLERTFALDLTGGGLDGLTDGGIAVGDELAQDLGLTVGDQVDVAFVPEAPPQRLEVVATFEPVALPGGSGLVGQLLVDRAFYARNVPFALDAAVFLRLAEGAQPADVRAAIEQALEPYPGAQVVDATEIRQQVAAQTNQLLGLVFGLLLLSVVIALFGVVNVLWLSVIERTRELGLLQAVGMTRGQAREMVRWESVLIALLGAVLGLAVGIAFGWLGVRALEDEGLRVFRLPVAQMAAAVGVAALAGVLASVLPARLASRVDVLRALQVDG